MAHLEPRLPLVGREDRAPVPRGHRIHIPERDRLVVAVEAVFCAPAVETSMSRLYQSVSTRSEWGTVQSRRIVGHPALLRVVVPDDNPLRKLFADVWLSECHIS